MRRRALLSTAGSLPVALAGCAGLTGDDGADPDGTGTTPDDSDDRHDLYLANLLGETRRIRLSVVRTDRDETVVSGTYELDDGQAAEFEDLAGWAGSYEVTATLPDDRSESFDWPREGCPNEGGSRNASVRVGGGDGPFAFVVDNCDEIFAGTEASAGPAENFEVEDYDEGDETA